MHSSQAQDPWPDIGPTSVEAPQTVVAVQIGVQRHRGCCSAHPSVFSLSLRPSSAGVSCGVVSVRARPSPPPVHCPPDWLSAALNESVGRERRIRSRTGGVAMIRAWTTLIASGGKRGFDPCSLSRWPRLAGLHRRRPHQARGRGRIHANATLLPDDRRRESEMRRGQS